MRSAAQPYLYGHPGVATFTRRYGRWLPADLAAVSPDSSHYAYGESYADSNGPRSRIHVVDVASAIDRVLYDRDFYDVIGYEAEGIYLFSVGYADAPSSGLWLLDPRNGSLQLVAPRDRTVETVGGGAAWYSDLAPGDQVPASIDNPMARAFFRDRVVRLDLKSHATTPWFRQPGKQVSAIGVDGQGRPILTVGTTVDGSSTTAEELWLVTAPGAGKKIYSGPGSKSPDHVSFGAPLADSHGLWFGSDKGIDLLTADGKFQRISPAVGQVAGRCS